jgi:folate-binding Fe-S cluster repair protein YgfZ
MVYSHTVSLQKRMFCRSHWGRMKISGEDRLKFLHSLSTADIIGMQPGQSFDTVFTTSKVQSHLHREWFTVAGVADFVSGVFSYSRNTEYGCS